MSDYIKGICIGLLAFSWGWMAFELWQAYDLPVVSENSGECLECDSKTVVIIRER